MKYFLSLVLIIACLLNSTAQDNIYVEEEYNVRRIMDMRKELNFRKDRYVKAWSIQILVTRDKYLANKTKEEFSKKFKDQKIDWEYQQPYYRLNVGAYYTKLEATMALNKLLEEYPDAYIFKNSQTKPADF